MDRSWKESSQGKEVVDGGGTLIGRYWSVGSGSKSSRYSGMWAEDGWLNRGEWLKRHIDESWERGVPV